MFSWIRVPPKVDYQCHRVHSMVGSNIFGEYESPTGYKNAQLRPDSKVLVFVETQYTRLGKHIVEVLEAVRFKYKIEIAGKSLPLLTSSDKGKYSAIVFENLFKYFHLNKWNRDLLDKYCREFNVGIIGFIVGNEQADNHKKVSDQLNHPKGRRRLDNLPIYVESDYQIKDYQLNAHSNIFRITRPGSISLGIVPENNWSIFTLPPNSSSFFPIAQALPRNYIVDTYPDGYKYSNIKKLNKLSNSTSIDWNNYKKNLLTTVFQDNGSYDGIKRIVFGNGLDYWLHKLIFLDSLSYLSNGKWSLPLQRYIQIDIDDIFVGEKGTRMKAVDVEMLIEFQQRLALLIPGFKFNLGYSGKFFHRGYPDENDGDDFLLKKSDHFRWFCHTFTHSQAHLTNNATIIENELLFNREFAKVNNLPTYNVYTVSPHHSGVYPIHEPLFDVWKRISEVRVTSTEEYPHLRPAHLRRGFIYKDVMVLPRQTCGLYTHTIFIDKYPGGRDKLEKSIFGGDLFYSFVVNQINVYMTHQSNYANDRLALYTFEAVIKFIQCWTNLQLFSLPPLELARKYFQIYPEEKDPIWMNPCEDRRHYNIWSLSKSCFQLPQFLILGPQKTGSTALYFFLSMHPSVISNQPSTDSFEEVQFFNGKNYNKGIDWYMNFFQLPNSSHFTLPIDDATTLNNSSTNSSLVQGHMKFFQRIPPPYKEAPPYFFEKSSTYFDGELVPMRVHSLLPHAKLIVILISPLKRAYSWYQHMKAHNLSIALNYTFYEVVSLDVQHKNPSERTMKKLRDLRQRCLGPGAYALHLERWLTFFSPQQMLFVDGDELRLNPINVMDKLQMFLKLEPYIDYSKMLRFDQKKGFYCQVTKGNSTKCLGKSKGRIYPEMDTLSRNYLHHYYLHHNVVLSKLLNRLRVRIPTWLELELSNNL
ncbi:hypothetical protein RDWZM_007515 [Blomia tropicalis]|uniref:[heparan sulfate]-glucosamine N-sulfotransferase n=1 Tax=Blomia tropicalis TaxID=40697 RepID=A0A9Q0M0C3_BLOTA|nr:hypothetical protein RDWZM_007515 [Blomia tropicalis]